MSTSNLLDCVEIVSIRVYWRTHDEFGRIPWRKQEWWFELCDSQGGQCFLPLADWIDYDIQNITEAVVEIAARNGVVIGVDQVMTDTVRRTASWAVGGEE